MMTCDEVQILLRPEVQEAIAANLESDSVRVAMTLRQPYAAQVATQIKYLQRARHKLPSYYAARAIIPSLAFEQSSSEECAVHKPLSGDSVLDLTCGLGVDSAALSRNFRRAVSIERDEVLAQIARHNFSRMGISNIEVITGSAEQYLASCKEHFDWCYVDPDRRSAQGRKLVRLEECSPDILALMPHIERLGARLCVKCSPMFDVEQAFRLFEGCSVEVVSLADECKEVLIYTRAESEQLRATALGIGSFAVDAAHRKEMNFCTKPFEGSRYKFLTLPDVALQKARITAAAFRGKADVWSHNGCAFSQTKPCEVLGRTFDIEEIVPYVPKELRKRLQKCGVELLLRDFALPAQQILHAVGAHEGGEQRWCFTTIEQRMWAIKLGNRCL